MVFIDNISTFIRTGHENEGDSWSPVQGSVQLHKRGATVSFNPVILTVIGISAADYALYDIFCEKKDTEDNPGQPHIGDERLDETFNTVDNTVSLMDGEAIKKEIIRQAMS